MFQKLASVLPLDRPKVTLARPDSASYTAA